MLPVRSGESKVELVMAFSEETEAVLSDLVVHEEEEYYLIEAVSERARGRIGSDRALVERLIALYHCDPSFKKTSEMELSEVLAYVSASSNSAGAGNPFRDRPSTDNWHPESVVRSTDQFISLRAAIAMERDRE